MTKILKIYLKRYKQRAVSLTIEIKVADSHAPWSLLVC